MTLVLQDLKAELTPLDMLMKLCAPCPFYFETVVKDGRVVKPECRIRQQHLCIQAAAVYLAIQNADRVSTEPPSPIAVPNRRSIQT